MYIKINTLQKVMQITIDLDKGEEEIHICFDT